MRRNGPVTQRELDYRDSAIILSRSDRKGVVTDVNRDFIEISGYSRAEAMGQPHNFLRHPDMPPAAFADLWRTLKRGRLWNGVIKNRAKNGDHYWVEANVAPVLDEQGKVQSYVSVRTKPTREQIAAAEARYHDIALGKARFPRHAVNVRPVVYGLLAGLAAAFALLAVLGAPWPAVAASSAALGALLAWQIERLIFRPLDGLRRTMLDCQADGNLKRRARIFRDDDLGQLAKTFNALMLTMRSVTREVHNEAGEVSQEIAGLAEFGSEVQANSAAQYDATMAAAASLEQFTTCSSTIADAARDVKQAAMASRDLIVGGHHRVEAFRTDLDSIAASVDAIDRAAAELAARTAEITRMVDHVRDIADQTNLLALNAAIEAARAGEHGRGFAVVADEVRKLAGTSGATAAQIRQTTERIITSTGAVKKVVDSTLDRVRRGEESMVEVARVLADSKSQFEVTHKGIMEISLATNEQASTGNAIAQSFEAISRRGEENDRAMRSLAKLADRSNARARALTELVADFK